MYKLVCHSPVGKKRKKRKETKRKKQVPEQAAVQLQYLTNN